MLTWLKGLWIFIERKKKKLQESMYVPHIYEHVYLLPYKMKPFLKDEFTLLLISFPPFDWWKEWQKGTSR